MRICEYIDLQTHNTLGIAVSARYFLVLQRPDDLRVIRQWCQENPGLPVLFLGGGSNVLFTQDFPGLVIQVAIKGREVVGSDADYVYIRAGAGEIWHDFVRWTIAQGYAGLENLSLIPGTVGAAPMQNIGAYGVELKDRFQQLQAIDWHTADVRSFDNVACQFAYRDSHFKSIEPERWLITSVTFRLPLRPQWRIEYAGVREHLLGRVPTARLISDAIMAIRHSKLPDPAKIGNAGSFFKNPVLTAEKWQALHEQFPELPGWPQGEGQVKTSAGWLIDQCGWKGQREKDAGTYEHHALVLVNHGRASGQEIWQFAQRIVVSVVERFGIELEPEPRVIGQ